VKLFKFIINFPTLKIINSFQVAPKAMPKLSQEIIKKLHISLKINNIGSRQPNYMEKIYITLAIKF